ncbi:hypothetical protein ACLOJK_032924 [Asimina triloba]
MLVVSRSSKLGIQGLSGGVERDQSEDMVFLLFRADLRWVMGLLVGIEVGLKAEGGGKRPWANECLEAGMVVSGVPISMLSFPASLHLLLEMLEKGPKLQGG